MNLVFDFGAVLFQWQPLQLVAEYFPQRAADPAQAGHLAHALFSHADWQNFDRGTLGLDEVVRRSAQRLSLDPALMHGLVADIAGRLVPMAESVELLRQLHTRGRALHPTLRLYYLSNMPVPYARHLEQHYDFLQWFDCGVFSGDVQHIKPEPSIYLLLQERFQCVAHQTVFIDDLLGNVQAAQALGWHGIHFHSAAQTGQALADMGLCP